MWGLPPVSHQFGQGSGPDGAAQSTYVKLRHESDDHQVILVAVVDVQFPGLASGHNHFDAAVCDRLYMLPTRKR